MLRNTLLWLPSTSPQLRNIPRLRPLPLRLPCPATIDSYWRSSQYARGHTTPGSSGLEPDQLRLGRGVASE